MLLHNYTAEPRQDGVTVFDPIRFKIGDGNLYTPISGTANYSNPLLVGLTGDEYSVHRNNYGYLFPDIPGVVTPHITTDPGTGSFAFIGTDQFNDQEEFLIQRSAQIVSNVINTSVIGKWFAGFLNVSSDTDYVSSHLRNLIRFQGSVAYYFRVLSTPPIGYAFVFQNFGTGAANSISSVIFENAPLIWNNSTRGFIDLPLYTECAVVFDGANWNVIYITDSRWQVAAVIPLPGQILGVGSTLVGDVGAGVQVFNVIHNLNITGDYLVFLSIKDTASSVAFDNDLGITWRHHATLKANQFILSVEERTGGSQNATICWLIIKI